MKCFCISYGYLHVAAKGCHSAVRAPLSDGSDTQLLSHVTVSVTAVEWGIYQQ